MTEEEAKTKWCPQFRVATSGGDGSTFEMDNRPLEHKQDENQKWCATGYIHVSARCLGSDCMAWRTLDHMAGTLPPGYCGLAGKP